MHLRYDALANLSNVVRINVLADADLPARVATFYIEAGFAKKCTLFRYHGAVADLLRTVLTTDGLSAPDDVASVRRRGRGWVFAQTDERWHGPHRQHQLHQLCSS